MTKEKRKKTKGKEEAAKHQREGGSGKTPKGRRKRQNT
jgi:hypothetical protein